MPPDAVLTLAQWLSPAFPVGAFAYSHGLEWAVEAGHVGDAATLQDWLEDVLCHGAGRADAVLLCCAWAAESDDALAEVEAVARASAASRERLAETGLQGAALAQTVAAVWGHELRAMCYPVALGRAARLHGLPRGMTAAMYLHAFAANLTSAAMRLVPLGQTDGQRVLGALTPLCQQIAEQVAEATLDDVESCTFLSDIAAMRHETQRTRLFRT